MTQSHPDSCGSQQLPSGRFVVYERYPVSCSYYVFRTEFDGHVVIELGTVRKIRSTSGSATTWEASCVDCHWKSERFSSRARVADELYSHSEECRCGRKW